VSLSHAIVAILKAVEILVFGSELVRLNGMGRIFGLTVLFVLASFAGRVTADDIHWQQNPAQAWKNASESGRPMFIYATMEGCVHCRRMEQSTFSHLTVKTHVNEHFVPIYMPLDRHEQIMERWQITTFPTTLLVAPNGSVLARIKGYTAADELIRQSSAALRTKLPVAETAKTKSDSTQR